MTLAFVSDTPIGISSTEGAGDDVNVGSISMSEEAEGIVSAFNVSVNAQGNGRLGYAVRVHLKMYYWMGRMIMWRFVWLPVTSKLRL